LLLVFALCIHVAGHVVSAFATNFELLLIVRALTLLRAAICAPQAAATAGVVGNWLASRLVAQLGIGPGRRLRHCLLDCGSQSVRRQPGHADGPGGVGLWGLESLSSNSLQQSRLVVVAPGLATASVALDTSVVYLDPALGAGLGGWFMKGGMVPSMIWTARTLALLALLASFFAARLKQIQLLSELAQFVFEFRYGLKQICHQPKIGDLKDGGFLILVDSDDDL
jgi:hypothetical protein